MNTKLLIGIFVSALLGTGGFYGKWMWDAHTTIALLQAQREADRAANDVRFAQLQATQGKFWKLHGWSHSKINRLEQATNTPVSDYPDLP